MVKNLKKGLAELRNLESGKVRYPKDNEIIGVVDKRFGGNRMRVRTVDGGEIMGIVPGRAKKFLWIREGDLVLLVPWELDKSKADLLYKFKPNEIKKLEDKGYLKDIMSEVEEF